ncbi:MAG: hypothetical protein GF353_28730 [Candidatus Lokiarchaeota archaeon]|nr:hypothetical protein [Candidatus Lokiarchaeota archaeon]MBD3353988.1 hypothetical protein [Candidatus Lokiarchaeota archaeon]
MATTEKESQIKKQEKNKTDRWVVARWIAVNCASCNYCNMTKCMMWWENPIITDKMRKNRKTERILTIAHRYVRRYGGTEGCGFHSSRFAPIQDSIQNK